MSLIQFAKKSSVARPLGGLQFLKKFSNPRAALRSALGHILTPASGRLDLSKTPVPASATILCAAGSGSVRLLTRAARMYLARHVAIQNFRHWSLVIRNSPFVIYFASSLRPAFRLSKFKIALNTRK